MNQERIKQCAGILALNRVRNETLKDLPEECRPVDFEEAYAVQDQLHALLDEAGYGKKVGYKIGCTTPIMQKFLGIHSPCVGGIYNTATNYISVSAKLDNFAKPGVECELAAFIGNDLIPYKNGSKFTRKSVEPAVQAVFSAIEIVDDRWIDYKKVNTPSLIADDFFGSAIVLSKPIPSEDAPDLSNARGRMTVNGEQVSEGTTGEILGHPYEALAWLANSLAERNQYLKSGEIVMLGSIVETHWVKRKDEIAVEIDGIGGVLVKFI